MICYYGYDHRSTASDDTSENIKNVYPKELTQAEVTNEAAVQDIQASDVLNQ